MDRTATSSEHTVSPNLPEPGSIHELAITALASNGSGIGRINGFTVFCESGIPGQKLAVEITHLRKRYAEASPVRVIHRSPDECAAPCPHASTCGGCPWQTLPPASQNAWKETLVRDAMERIAHRSDFPILPLHPSLRAWGYRNKIAFSFGESPDGTLILGQKARRSHDVADLTSCRLLDGPCGELLETIREEARKSGLPARTDTRPEGYWRHLIVRTPHSGPVTAEIIINPRSGNARCAADALSRVKGLDGYIVSSRTGTDNLAVGERIIQRSGNTELSELFHRDLTLFPAGTPAELRLTLPHNAFLQVNTLAAECLYNAAAKLLGNRPVSMLWDIYCGVGSIGLFLAPLARSICGVETVASAITHARSNAAAAGIANAQFHAGDARIAFNLMRRHPLAGESAVVVDPPRAGLSPEVVQGLCRIRPERLIYISCNPATLARDLQLLETTYHVESIQPFDLFPQTPHVETIVLLRR